MLGLWRDYPQQIGILHRRQRMVLHTTFIEQDIAHKQMTFEYGSTDVGEGGRRDRKVCF